ncbi:hypothetical protein MMC20_006353 [Loxospora ochrophaea]|nr:hypothetical protein [Loxospora ochrophaea]
MASKTTHNIVILGGNFGGLGVAHYLLRHVVPILNHRSSTAYKVTVVSPSTHAYFKIATPRALINAELIPLSKTILPIEDGFKDYSPEIYTFVQGTAIGLDEESKVITIAHHTQQTSNLQYSTLVVATGTTSTSPVWTLHGAHTITIDAIQELHKSLPSAKTVLIAGGGPAGVETAGEVAFHYPNAKVTMLSGNTRLLPRLYPATSQKAEAMLTNLNAEVVHNVQVKGSHKVDNGQTEVELNDNTTRSVDVYIDATGGKPNTAFLPKSWLNERGAVLTDDKTMRSTVAKEVYAIGDAASYSQGSVIDINDSVAPTGSSIFVDLSAAIPNVDNEESAQKEKPAPGLFSFLTSFWHTSVPGNVPAQKNFKPTLNTQFVPIGPKGGVGQLFGWKAPSFFVWLLKGRTYFTEKASELVSGAAYMKA